MKRILVLLSVLGLFIASPALAHRSGCHRWHSCPSDTGSYVCGDIGYCSGCGNNYYCKNRAYQPGWQKVKKKTPQPKKTSLQPKPLPVIQTQAAKSAVQEPIATPSIQSATPPQPVVNQQTPEQRINESLAYLYSQGVIKSQEDEKSLIRYTIDNRLNDLRYAAVLWYSDVKLPQIQQEQNEKLVEAQRQIELRRQQENQVNTILNEYQQKVNAINKQILDLQTQYDNAPDLVKQQTVDYFVNAAQLDRLIADKQVEIVRQIRQLESQREQLKLEYQAKLSNL